MNGYFDIDDEILHGLRQNSQPFPFFISVANRSSISLASTGASFFFLSLQCVMCAACACACACVCVTYALGGTLKPFLFFGLCAHLAQLRSAPDVVAEILFLHDALHLALARFAMKHGGCRSRHVFF